MAIIFLEHIPQIKDKLAEGPEKITHLCYQRHTSVKSPLLKKHYLIPNPAPS